MIDDALTDDRVLPFEAEGLDVRGRIVRLGPAIDLILRRHAYPDAVSRALAEATALTLLLGTALKFDGRFILQTRTNGSLRMMVVDFRHPTACGPAPPSTRRWSRRPSRPAGPAPSTSWAPATSQ